MSHLTMSSLKGVETRIQSFALKAASLAAYSPDAVEKLRQEHRDLNAKVVALKLKHSGIFITGEEILSRYVSELSSSSGGSSPLEEESGVEIRVECALAPGEFLEVKGSGALDQPIPLVHRGGNTYAVFLKGICPDQDYKVRLNGSTWERGESRRVQDSPLPLNILGRSGTVSCAYLGSPPVKKIVEFFVKIALGEGETIALRGGGAILNWGRDNPLEKIGEDLYSVELRGLYPDTEFKLVINGRQWEEGGNHRVKEGISELRFSGRSGEVIVDASDFHQIVAGKVHRKVAERSTSARCPSRFELAANQHIFQSYLTRSEFIGWNSYTQEEKFKAFTTLVGKIPVPVNNRVIARLLQLFDSLDGVKEKTVLLFNIMTASKLLHAKASEKAVALESLAKGIYAALSPDLQGKLRWNIFLANDKSAHYEGIHRGDLGQYVIENAFLSELCLKGVERLKDDAIRNHKIEAFLSSQEFQQWESYSPIQKSNGFFFLAKKLPLCANERVFSRLLELYRDISEPARSLSSLYGVIFLSKRIENQPQEEGKYRQLKTLAKKMYAALPGNLQSNIRWHIFLANNRSGVYEGADRGDLGRYIVEHAFCSPLGTRGVLNSYKEQKIAQFLSQQAFQNWGSYSFEQKISAFKSLFVHLPLFKSERVKLRLMETFRTITEPKNQIFCLYGLMNELRTMQGNIRFLNAASIDLTLKQKLLKVTLQLKCQVVEDLAKEVYDALPEELQERIESHIFAESAQSTPYRGVEPGDVGRHVLQNDFRSDICFKAIRAVAAEFNSDMN